MKRIAAILLVFFFFVPATTLAAEFVHAPLFLSKTPVTEGQKVLIYAIISNTASTSFAGSVQISADGAVLGAPTTTLAVGATQTISLPWEPKAGNHTVTAQLTNIDGSVVQNTNQTFTVLAAPKPVATSTATTTTEDAFSSSTPIVQTLRGLSPVLASTTAPVFASIDTERARVGKVLGAQIENLAPPAKTSSSTSTTSSGLYREFLTLVKNLISNAALFYFVVLVLACALIVLLTKLFSRGR